RRPILDRLAGVHEFGLAQNGAFRRGGGALEHDQRRIADGVDDSVPSLHFFKAAQRVGPASSTSVSVPGPSPTMMTQASSSLAPSQCTCLPKCVTKLPLGMGTILSLSTLLPVATHQVPLTTVMKRSLGWKCGLLKLPGLNRLRTT